MDQFEEKLRLAFAAVTDYYGDHAADGNTTPPPITIIQREMRTLLQERDLEVNNAKTVEIQLSDDKLKNVYGEDWLTYRDDRLKELEDERSTIREVVPHADRGSLDVQGRPQEGVVTLPTSNDTDRRGEPDSKGRELPVSGSDSIVS